MLNEEKRAVLLALEDAEGRLTPELVLREATDLDHPLHNEFIWDDSIAGHRFRLGQARAMIRSVQYVEVVEMKTYAAPVYVRDPGVDQRTQGYRAVTKLRTDEEEARAAIVREFSVVAAHLRRARQLATVLGLAEEVDELLHRVVNVQQAATATSTEATSPMQ